VWSYTSILHLTSHGITVLLVLYAHFTPGFLSVFVWELCYYFRRLRVKRISETLHYNSLLNVCIEFRLSYSTHHQNFNVLHEICKNSSASTKELHFVTKLCCGKRQNVQEY